MSKNNCINLYRRYLTVLNIVIAAFVMPEYMCSPVTWKANLARIVSNGYVKRTAVMPAAEPAKNLLKWCWFIKFPRIVL